nr:hypothetical protein [Tanacetum cinerariifolium]
MMREADLSKDTSGPELSTKLWISVIILIQFARLVLGIGLVVQAVSQAWFVELGVRDAGDYRNVAVEVESPLVVKETMEKEKLSLVVNTFDFGSTTVNFRTLFTSRSNGIDVVVLVESIRAIRTLRGKYGLVRSMFSSSTWLFSYQFSSIKGLNSMLENGSWFIRNNPLILKKWHPDVNLLKEDVGTVSVWVKLHGVPVTAFNEDSLSAIATKLAKLPILVDLRSGMRSRVVQVLLLPLSKINKMENLIIDGKAILVNDEGKPLRKVNEDSEDEVASDDNEMASFLAKRMAMVHKVCLSNGSILTSLMTMNTTHTMIDMFEGKRLHIVGEEEAEGQLHCVFHQKCDDHIRLFILSDTEPEVMATPVVLLEIALEAKAAVVALPTAVLVHVPNSPFWRKEESQKQLDIQVFVTNTSHLRESLLQSQIEVIQFTCKTPALLKVRLTVLDLVIKTGLEVKPFEALPSPDYVPTSLIHAPASLTQVAPPPPVQITPTSLTEPTSIGPSRERCRSLPPASAVPPPVVLSPCKRMLLPQLDTSYEVAVLHGLLGIADLEIRAKDAEDRLEKYELGLIHDRARIQRLKEHLDI